MVKENDNDDKNNDNDDDDDDDGKNAMDFWHRHWSINKVLKTKVKMDFKDRQDCHQGRHHHHHHHPLHHHNQP